MKVIKTIGHSNHPIERFVDLLKAGGVERLVDVRSIPGSRRFPQFGREQLNKRLADAGIDYVWEGEALGGKPAQGGGYNELAARPAFQDALARLIQHSDDTTLCLMCAEKEPLECHRVLREIDPLIFLELGHEPVHDPLVEVVTTQVGIAVGALHFEDPLGEL